MIGFFFSSRRRHTRCALVTGVQTCALPIYSWSQVAAEVRDLAAGLLSLGVRRGDKVAIVGDNRPRLYWTITAVQALGGIPVPLYQDAVADEIAYVLEHAEARFAVVEDQEQVDKLQIGRAHV